MRLFISGPMHGYPNHNKEAFDEAEAYLRSKGISVFNPSCMYFDETYGRHEKLHIDYAIIDICDGIYQLDDWDTREGSVAEWKYAQETNKMIFTKKSFETFIGALQ